MKRLYIVFTLLITTISYAAERSESPLERAGSFLKRYRSHQDLTEKTTNSRPRTLSAENLWIASFKDTKRKNSITILSTETPPPAEAAVKKTSVSQHHKSDAENLFDETLMYIEQAKECADRDKKSKLILHAELNFQKLRMDGKMDLIELLLNLWPDFTYNKNDTAAFRNLTSRKRIG
jgi:LPS O-antigen subunit length determinant protein (WzzB/FepE family)